MRSLIPFALSCPLFIHSSLFCLSVSRASSRITPICYCACCRIRQNDSLKFLDSGYRCSSPMSPCGSIASISSRFLFRLYPSIVLFSKTPALCLIKGRQIHPTFSSSLVQCDIALVKPSGDELVLMRHRTSFWFFRLRVFALFLFASADRLRFADIDRHRPKAVYRHLAPLAPLALPSPLVSHPLLSCVLARSRPQPRLLKTTVLRELEGS